MPKLEIAIEERLDLCGYAYFKEGSRQGRVFWICEANGPSRHKLTLDCSWGMPSDRALRKIGQRVIEFVKNPRPAPLP